MSTLKRVIVCLVIAAILPVYNLSAYAEYDDDYRQKLLALYDCLDKQLTEFEQTEETEIQLEFPDFKVANRDHNVSGAIQYYDARKIIAMLCGDHPRLLSSVNFISRIAPSKGSDLLSAIRLKRLEIEDTYENVYKMIDEKADEIIAEVIKDGMTDLDKALAVYLYMAKNYTPNGDRENLDRDTIYGAMILQSPACGGYAGAYQFVMKKLGIRCEIADSHSAGHLWNYIELDGKWYHADVSWGNYDDKTKAECFLISNAARKKHLLVNDSRIYDWENIHKYVVCDDDTYETGYLFNILKNEGLRTLTYDNGDYYFEAIGYSFHNNTLRHPMPKIVSEINTETGEAANPSNLNNAFFAIYGNSKPYILRTVGYDSDGRMVSTAEYQDNGWADVIVMRVPYTPAENIDHVKIFIWNDMMPLSEVTEVRK